jgi:hypothetical protein
MRGLTPFEREHQTDLAISELADALQAAGLLPDVHPGLDTVRAFVAAVKSGRLRDPSMPPDPLPTSKYHAPGPPSGYGPNVTIHYEDDLNALTNASLEPR